MPAIISLFSWIPREAMLLGLTVPACLAVGFACGLLYERWYQASQLARLTRRFEKLFEYVSGLLEKSDQACRALGHVSQTHPLNPQQQGKLQLLTSQLTSRLSQLTGSRSEPSTVSADVKKTLKNQRSRQDSPTWKRDSLDSRTGLPDAIAFDQNLSFWCSPANTSGTQGLLFVQLDDYYKQAQRFGADAANDFLQQISSTALKHLRDQDLLCQISDDVLIACLPEVDEARLIGIADQIRSAVRRHSFTQPGQQQSVYVTASFGCMSFQPGEWDDPLKMIALRSRQVLSASRKKGRCRLHRIDSDGHPRLIAG